MTSLYVLADEYRYAADKLATMELDEQSVTDTLEGLSGAMEVKATNVAMFARNLEATAQAIMEAETAMAARRKAIEARAARIRDYLKTSMEFAGITKIECPYFSLAVRENPPRVVIESEGLIPAEFMHQPEPPPPKPDKKAIADALKEGRTVLGAHLERGKRLEIK
jgi:hypothetical protein